MGGGRAGASGGPPPTFPQAVRGRRRGRVGRLPLLALGALALTLLIPPRPAQAADPTFTEADLADPANVALGKQLFKQQCALCHGHLAYPGKVPHLKPRWLSPDDVYARITYGYGKMPPREDVFTDEQRMAITAYLKSPNFSN